jgi:hypothetical protein
MDSARQRSRQAKLAADPVDAESLGEVGAENSELRLVLVSALEKLEARERELAPGSDCAASKGSGRRA